MWLTKVKRNALWWVRTQNFSTAIKIPSVCHRNFCQFVVNLPIAFPSSQLLRQFTWLHILQDVICWQSWSKNDSKYELVRRIYTNTTVEPNVLVRVGQFTYSKLQSHISKITEVMFYIPAI